MTQQYRIRGTARLASVSLAALVAAGCLSDITKVDERDVIPPDQLTTAAGAQALYVGAIRAFGVAIDGNNGGTEGQILISGLLSDEWSHSGTFNTRRDYDQRGADLNNGTLSGAFRNLQDARTASLRAIDAINATSESPSSDDRIGQLQNRIGAIYLAGAQNYCNGVPYTEVVGGDLQYGDPLTGDQQITQAISWFDQAIAGPAGDNNINLYTAQLLKARALMLQGSAQYGAAAALVAGIPTSFRAMSEHSIANGGNENGVYVFNWLSERWTMSQNEGGNGLPYRGAGDGTDPAQADPRLPWEPADDGIGFDNETPQYNWLGSGGRDQPIAFAKGEEARLIEAEAALANNDITTFMTKLNDLRTTVAGLAPLTDPGTAAGRVDMLFSERGFWLYSTGVRLSDMRRLIRQYGRGAETVFPTGAYHKPGDYGTDVNIPVILDETQNPNFTGCLDRNP